MGGVKVVKVVRVVGILCMAPIWLVCMACVHGSGNDDICARTSVRDHAHYLHNLHNLHLSSDPYIVAMDATTRQNVLRLPRSQR